MFSTNIKSITDPKKRKDRRSYHKYSFFRRAALLCYLQHGTHVIIWYNLTETGNWAAFSTHGRPIEATLIMFQTIDEMQRCGNVELNIDIDDQWETFYEEEKGYAQQLLDALSALRLSVYLAKCWKQLKRHTKLHSKSVHLLRLEAKTKVNIMTLLSYRILFEYMYSFYCALISFIFLCFLLFSLSQPPLTQQTW